MLNPSASGISDGYPPTILFCRDRASQQNVVNNKMTNVKPVPNSIAIYNRRSSGPTHLIRTILYRVLCLLCVFMLYYAKLCDFQARWRVCTQYCWTASTGGRVYFVWRRLNGELFNDDADLGTSTVAHTYNTAVILVAIYVYNGIGDIIMVIMCVMCIHILLSNNYTFSSNLFTSPWSRLYKNCI